ncbi:MAG: hypothetical protein ACW964_09075 [Candidatus Hodarchaeales archaeon]
MDDPALTNDTRLLMQILEELKSISNRLKTIENSIKDQNIHSDEMIRSEGQKTTVSSIPSSLDIINLQESRPGIFNTYKAIQKMEGWVTSTAIAEATGRSRGLESRYLNYLADDGFLLKKRVKVPSEDKATTVHYRIVGVEE